MKSFEERYVMEDDSSRKDITRQIWSGFDVHIEY